MLYATSGVEQKLHSGFYASQNAMVSDTLRCDTSSGHIEKDFLLSVADKMQRIKGHMRRQQLFFWQQRKERRPSAACIPGLSPNVSTEHCFQLRHGTSGRERRDIKEEKVFEQLDVANLLCIYTSCASSRDRWYSVIHNDCDAFSHHIQLQSTQAVWPSRYILRKK